MLPKILAVSSHNRLAEIAKSIPARNPRLLARFINDPRPRDGPVFARDDDYSRDVPHAFVTHVFDQPTGEKLIGHAANRRWVNLGKNVSAMLDQVEDLLGHSTATH